MKQTCSGLPSISKATVKAMLVTPVSHGVGDPQAISAPLQLLNKLDDSEWEIVSFDPKTRLVCIEVANHNGVDIHLPVILPALTL